MLLTPFSLQPSVFNSAFSLLLLTFFSAAKTQFAQAVSQRSHGDAQELGGLLFGSLSNFHGLHDIIRFNGSHYLVQLYAFGCQVTPTPILRHRAFPEAGGWTSFLGVAKHEQGDTGFAMDGDVTQIFMDNTTWPVGTNLAAGDEPASTTGDDFTGVCDWVEK